MLEVGVYRGTHDYSLTPMIRIMLDLGQMEHWPSGISRRLHVSTRKLPDR